MKLTKKQMAVVESDAAKRIITNSSGGGMSLTLAACAIREQVRGKVLVLCPNRFAADRMYQRIQNLANDFGILRQIGVQDFNIAAVECRTIHSFCLMGGGKRNIDEDSTDQDLITKVLKQKRPDLAEDRNIINRLFRMYSHRTVNTKWMKKEQVQDIFNAVERLKKKMGLQTFNDLLVDFCERLDRPYFLKRIRREYPVIMVDDFQNISTMAWRIIKRLAGKGIRLLVAGDDAQVGYAWADSSFKRLDHFKKAFPDHKEFWFRKNFRATTNILEVVDGLANDVKYRDLEMESGRTGPRPTIMCDQKMFNLHGKIVGRILNYQKAGVPLDQMAVLYRFGRDVYGLREFLRRAGIPYQVVGDKSLRGGPFVRLLLALVEIVTQDELADESWMEVLKNVEGVGGQQAGKILTWLKAKQPYEFQYPRQLAFTIPLRNLLFFIHNLKTDGRCGEDKLLAMVDLIKTMPKINKSVRDYIVPTMVKIVHDHGLRHLSERFLDTSYPLCFPHTNKPLFPNNYLTLSTVNRMQDQEFEVVFHLGSTMETYKERGCFETERAEKQELHLMNIAVSRARTHLHLFFPISTHEFEDELCLDHPSVFLYNLMHIFELEGSIPSEHLSDIVPKI